MSADAAFVAFAIGCAMLVASIVALLSWALRGVVG